MIKADQGCQGCGGQISTAKGHKEIFWSDRHPFILMGVAITPVHTFVKTHQTVLLTSMPLILCKGISVKLVLHDSNHVTLCPQTLQWLLFTLKMKSTGPLRALHLRLLAGSPHLMHPASGAFLTGGSSQQTVLPLTLRLMQPPRLHRPMA